MAMQRTHSGRERPPPSGFGDLPCDVLAVIFAQLPLEERVHVPARVCKHWREAARQPSSAWEEFTWSCGSMEQFMGLLRWLRPRIRGVHRLHLSLCATVPVTRHRRFANRCTTALQSLAARLSKAVRLTQLTVVWDVDSDGYDSSLAAFLGIPRSFALNVAAMLPPQSKTARRRRHALLPHLQQLELSSGCGITLSPALHLLSGLQQLTLGPGRDADRDGGALDAEDCTPAECLPPSLTSLVLSARRAIELLSRSFHLAENLPQLRELRMPASMDDWSVLNAGRLLAQLAPLDGRLQRLELPPKTLFSAVSSFTALTHLKILRPRNEDAEEVWEGIFGSLRQLRSLDVTLAIESEMGLFPPLPLRLSSMPAGLHELCCLIQPSLDVSLPPGDYLWHLRKLCVGPQPALRLTPLLPFMPHLQLLVVDGHYQTYGSTSFLDQAPAAAVLEGDPAQDLDAAAAAGAALDLDGWAEQMAAAEQLAAALARHPRFCCLRLIDNRREIPTACLALALCVQRPSSRVRVEVLQGGGDGGGSLLWNL